MTHGSLFSGIGGFDLAAEWMGWENKFHCEWNEFGKKVLNYYWPNAESFHDITKTKFTKYAGAIDIISGGFPCQPYSTAGKRLGKEDERHLWPHMYRAIQEIKPRWIVGENVRGLISWNGGLVFEEVQADLEAAGYEVQPFLLPACGVNAPHRRDRVWFVAWNPKSDGNSKVKKVFGERERHKQSSYTVGGNSITGVDDKIRTFFNSNNKRGGSGLGQVQKEDGEIPQRNNDAEFSNSGGENATDSDNKRLERSKNIGIIRESGKKWNEQFAGQFCANWKNFPTVSPICNGNDGVSSKLDGITFSKWRNESIKAGGNAIVPQVALQIFKAIQAYEDGNS